MAEPIQEPSSTGERTVEDANTDITNTEERWLATQTRATALADVLDDALIKPSSEPSLSDGDLDISYYGRSPTRPLIPHHGTDADDTKKGTKISPVGAETAPPYAQKPDALAVLGNVVKALSADEASSDKHAISYNSYKGVPHHEELRAQLRTYVKRTEELLTTSLSEQTASLEDDARRLAQLLKEVNSFLQLPGAKSTYSSGQEDRDYEHHQTSPPAQMLLDIDKIIKRLTGAQAVKKAFSHDDEDGGKHLQVLCLGEICILLVYFPIDSSEQMGVEYAAISASLY
jgi:hypothetical protein